MDILLQNLHHSILFKHCNRFGYSKCAVIEHNRLNFLVLPKQTKCICACNNTWWSTQKWGSAWRMSVYVTPERVVERLPSTDMRSVTRGLCIMWRRCDEWWPRRCVRDQRSYTHKQRQKRQSANTGPNTHGHIEWQRSMILAIRKHPMPRNYDIANNSRRNSRKKNTERSFQWNTRTQKRFKPLKWELFIRDLVSEK